MVRRRKRLTCQCALHHPAIAPQSLADVHTATGNPGRFPAIAAVNWNKSPASLHPSYRELPFFQLADLDPPQARAKLVLIRDYLVEQKRRCEWRIRTHQGVGHRYFQRIRAYLAWSIYALGLVREQEAADEADASAPRAAVRLAS